jgi:hypothetical protein
VLCPDDSESHKNGTWDASGCPVIQWMRDKDGQPIGGVKIDVLRGGADR